MTVPVQRRGDHVLVVEYYSQLSDTLQELDVELVTQTGTHRGYLKLPSCQHRSVFTDHLTTLTTDHADQR